MRETDERAEIKTGEKMSECALVVFFEWPENPITNNLNGKVVWKHVNKRRLFIHAELNMDDFECAGGWVALIISFTVAGDLIQIPL